MVCLQEHLETKSGHAFVVSQGKLINEVKTLSSVNLKPFNTNTLKIQTFINYDEISPVWLVLLVKLMAYFDK